MILNFRAPLTLSIALVFIVSIGTLGCKKNDDKKPRTMEPAASKRGMLPFITSWRSRRMPGL